MGRIKALDPLLHFTSEAIYKDSQKAIDSTVSLIVNKIETPFSIAVNGSWGEGKTTMLILLQEKLKEAGYPTVWFNPWEYERSGDDVVLAFLKRLAVGFTKEFGIKDIGVFAASLFVAGIDATAQALTNKIVSYQNVKNIVEDASGLFDATRSDYVDPVKAIKEDFVKLTNTVKEKHDSNPLIIFLDDLDRCFPENAIALLEALKNLFVIKDASVIVISGIDISIAKKFIQKKYYELDPDYAVSYFRKVFNLTIDIPAVDHTRKHNYLLSYIEDLFDESDEIYTGSESVAEYVIKLVDASGMISVRRTLTIINQLFVCRLLNSKCKELGVEVVLPLLFLREVWNGYYCDFSLKVQKYHESTLKEVLKTEGYLQEIEKSDNNLYLFIQNHCLLDVPAANLIGANLF